MQQVEVTRHVAAPPERVWALATDLAGAPRVLSGVQRVEVLTPGPFAVGTRWRETRTMFGKEATEEMAVTAVEPQRSYTVEAESSGARYVSTFAFHPSPDGGTAVVLTFGAQATTGVAKVMAVLTGPLARRSVEKALRGDLEDLARAAEAG
ncbi:carbon monoxide dehydrogenase [Actinotalea ferrariae CF5-4]|uniref:Carbon monoxide dehydrogenase n=1 Tax=Actinotalea ferrariae CF5-4 TaxID=948458 RepID=A0A021VLG2_9CELL|nr:SRPBCC family protein [Actinotalea ferrariae]EYR62021.1 carbon monoxide dehydrogenase [Actinotalea ferrariae CF5-4]